MNRKQDETVPSEKIHIALFISALRKGGSERVLVNLAEYLKNQGVQVTVVTQYKGKGEYELSPDIKRVFSEITEEETSKSRAVNFVRRFRKLRRIWKEEKPDVILSFIGKNNLMALLTSSFLNIPVVISVRGEPQAEYASGLMRFLARLICQSGRGGAPDEGGIFLFPGQNPEEGGDPEKSSEPFFYQREV